MSDRRDRRVVIVADDLIWADRLAAAVRAAGASPVPVRSSAALGPVASDAAAVIVDLTARAYDGLEAVGLAAGHGTRVLAVAQHDDLELHRRARAAGAERVLAYRKLFEDGPATIAAFLERRRRSVGVAE